MCRIVFLRIESCQFDGRIGEHVLGQSTLPLDSLILKVLLGSDHEVGFYTVYFKQPLEVVVSSVKDVI